MSRVIGTGCKVSEVVYGKQEEWGEIKDTGIVDRKGFYSLETQGIPTRSLPSPYASASSGRVTTVTSMETYDLYHPQHASERQ